jgi:sensor histidine kinase YesM
LLELQLKHQLVLLQQLNQLTDSMMEERWLYVTASVPFTFNFMGLFNLTFFFLFLGTFLNARSDVFYQIATVVFFIVFLGGCMVDYLTNDNDSFRSVDERARKRRFY